MMTKGYQRRPLTEGGDLNDLIEDGKDRGELLSFSTMEFGRLSKSARDALGSEDARLLVPDSILADNTGDLAERYARIVLQQEGMPSGHGKITFDAVIDGKTDDAHGIDLIGVRDGAPTIIEVKKRSGSEVIGFDRNMQDPHPGVLKWVQEVQAERERSPFRSAQVDSVLDQARSQLPDRPDQWQDFDPEFSKVQMGEMWTRDRWLKTIDAPEVRQQLADAGVEDRFLDVKSLTDKPFSEEWQKILEGRTIVIVQGSDSALRVSDQLVRDAIFHRRVDVVGLRV